MFSRIAIVNRGEPARRLVHAVRELDHERGGGIRTIALHTEAERRATFVREADEAVLIGRSGAGNPYLDHAELERALRESRADAAWVGWGFVAEDPAFAELCERIGVVFVGPSARVMRDLGDKVAAKVLAERVGVPVAAWSGGAVETTGDALRHAATIGYPLMIKAAAGGGGRGIRAVASEADLAPALERARDEARRSFGDPSVLMERLVTGARHVEVQVIADSYGNAWAVGVRDCSIQRRSQKLIEESASPVLSAEQDRELRRVSLDLVRAAGYSNAGTIEFLYQPEEKAFSFLEVNTRLQVEHPVSELTSGLDLVKLQLHVADGGRLEGDAPAERGHAIEARVNAEDAERGFAPAPGTVALLGLPTGPGIRVDTGFSEGDEIPAEYDSMIAKVIAWGSDRSEARARLRRALQEMTVVVRGGATNRSFLLDLLDRPEVVDGSADTGWLDRLAAAGSLVSTRHADVALMAAAIDADDSEEALERESFYASARRGRPKASHEVGRMVELRHRGQAYRMSVARSSPRRYRVSLDGRALDAEVERLGRFESRLQIGAATHRVVSVFHAPDHLVEVDGVAHRVSRDEGGLVRAPAPALVVALNVTAGDEVSAGTPIVVLESMKMETSVAAPFDGIVAEVLVAGNVQVDAGAALVRLQPLADGSAGPSDEPRVELDGSREAPESDARARSHEVLAAIRGLMTGFDLRPGEARDLVPQLERSRSALPPGDPELVRGELELLTVFADLAELSRDRPPVSEDEEGEEAVHSPREHFHQYLRSLDTEREGLPEGLRASLARALGHYGVHDLTRSPQLAEAAYRIYLAQERVASQVPIVLALLDARLGDGDALPGPLREELRQTLDRLVTATQLRQPAVGELARSVRYSCFDRPFIRADRARVYAALREQLDHLAANPDAPDYAERIEAVVASPQPLISLLAERTAKGVREHEPMLEVLTRRYYKIRDLQDVHSFTRDGRQFVRASYVRDERRVDLVTTLADASDLTAVAAAIAELVAEGGIAEGVVADIYLTWNEPPEPDAMADEIASSLAAAAVAPVVRRLAVAVCSKDGEATHHFTFRPGDDGLREERVVRDLHPMISRRLQFWRLASFDVSRLPSVEDTYLFRCAGREDSAEERLVALAEVRDLTPVRDAAGAVTALPEVEHILAGCLEGIRQAQGHRPPKRRLQANHVFLSVWSPVEVPLRELSAVARRLAPMTAGLGLEEVLLHFGAPDGTTGGTRELALRFSYQPGAGVSADLTEAPTEPLAPLDEYTQRVLAARRRGAVYPYELVRLLTGPEGSFSEHDLDEEGGLRPVERPPGHNRAGVVAGIVRTPTDEHPEGLVRVALLGDPTRSLGSVAEPECSRILAAIDLAETMGVPVEWFAISSGAKISRDSGTENMDWVARVLRRLITFTQAGGEVNVVVAGINVGAQPYWNAEATMLLHTRGILVMTPDSAMVLTGKQALDYSGGVSAEDNFGIGGYDRIMGPNGEAQYWAPHLAGACELLFAHYAHAYVAPGERFPRRAVTTDPLDRDIRPYPHSGPGSDFRTVGDIFSATTNPERKKAFDARTLMRATIDQDRPPLERWAGMDDADTVIVFDAHLGGHPVTLLGIESRPIPRHRFLPADGPDQWTAGTLFPISSKKAARAINAASGTRPLVVLANLTGFDGSPESLRKCQLEYGAEIGRAVVNFDGPIVFCVVSRYHGGAFVVFSGALNDNMQVLAVEGSRASVIGGAPAAAVVFAGDVRKRTDADPRVADLERRLSEAGEEERGRLRAELAEVRDVVRSQKLGEVAAEFDAIHSVERAREVGSVDAIIPASRLRPLLIEAVERGMDQAEADRLS